MNKADLVKRMEANTGLMRKDIEIIVNELFKEIKKALSENKRIELRNFGVFMNKQRKAKLARNPRTGEPVNIPARLVTVFKPSKELKKMVTL